MVPVPYANRNIFHRFTLGEFPEILPSVPDRQLRGHPRYRLALEMKIPNRDPAAMNKITKK